MNKTDKQIEEEVKGQLYDEFAKLIESAGLSQVDFAKKVGCSPQHIANMELRTSAVTAKTLSKYAYKFGQKLNINLIPIENEQD